MNGSSKPPHKRKFRNGKNKKTKTIAYSQPDYRFVCCRKKCRHSAYYKRKRHPGVHTGQKRRNCQMLWMKNPEICLGCNL